MKIRDAIRNEIIRSNKSQKWIIDNAQYLTIAGSQAYGTETKDSDLDIYGFTIPPKDITFPFHNGYIYKFSKDVPEFNQWQSTRIPYKNEEIDVDIYNILRYFALCLENNPNMIDTLFTPINCVSHMTKIGEMVRNSRTSFLHKGSWHKFKGYAYSQLKKAKSQNRVGKRKEMVAKHGYDTKFAMHIFRLLGEVEQILLYKDIDLQRDKEELKFIRDGNYTIEQIEDKFFAKESALEKVYNESTLRDRPDVVRIKDLLVDCLEEHFGKIEAIPRRSGSANNLITDIKEVLNRYDRE